jgi:hypothetical protein
MKNNIIFIFLSLNFSLIFSQTNVSWEDLAKIEYKEKYFSEYDETFLYPYFSEHLKKLNEKEISVKGYFLNIDPTSEIFILSKNPMASCFFCGVGGPETAVEIVFNKPPEFRTDDIITVTGTLILNKDDIEHFNYILENCSAIKTK